jgi:hypothetical protein
MMFWEKILLRTVSLLTNVNKDMGLSYTNNTKIDRHKYVPVGINKRNYCARLNSLFLCFMVAW